MPAETFHTIPLSAETVKRLKALAEPLEDTYDSVVTRLLDFHDGKREVVQSDSNGKSSRRNGRYFDPFAPPSLTHTKVTFASLGGRHLENPNWSKLLDSALILAWERAGSFSAVKRIATANLVDGTKTNDGYHFLPDTGFSVQGQDANDAWRAVAHICRTLGIDAEVHFMWRVKEGATYPGTNGEFRIEGRS